MQIGLFQCPPGPGDVAGNLHRLERTAIGAASSGVQLLVCPEMFLCGYNIGAAAVRRLAEPRDGPSAVAMAEIARRAGLDIVYGYAERGVCGAIFNAVQWISASGACLGQYRKTHLFGELDGEMFKAADEVEPHLIEVNGWRVGLLICYDIEFPENARRLALAGADLIIVPTANTMECDFVASTIVPARAIENQIYVAYTNYCGHEHGLDYGGLSLIAAPGASIVALAGREQTVLTADIDLAAVAAARERYSYLRDRRPGLYRALAQPDQARSRAKDLAGKS